MNLQERENTIGVLAEIITKLWQEETKSTASFYAGELGDEAAARALITTFLDFYEEGKINHDGSDEALKCFHAMEKMLKRVLAVDMTEKSNRKGDLPKAMGLVTKRDAHIRVRDHVIYQAFDDAKYHTGVAGRPNEECADLVAAAFEQTGLLGSGEDAGLSTDKIIKTYQRIREEI